MYHSRDNQSIKHLTQTMPTLQPVRPNTFFKFSNHLSENSENNYEKLIRDIDG